MKYKRHPYNHVVERKLEQLPTVDADHLWNDMHSMLDEKMPQKKERRRFIGWLFTGKGFFLSGVALIVTLAGFSLFFLYPKENSAIAGKKPGAGKSIEDGSAIVSNDVKENITIATDTYQTQKKEEKITRTSSSLVVKGNLISYGFIIQQTKKHTDRFTAGNTYSQRVRPFMSITKTDEKIQETGFGSIVGTTNSTDQANSDVTHYNSISTHQDLLITTDYIALKNSSIQQQKKPVANSARMNINTRDEKGFYAGIVSGVDLSAIHFQTAKTGATKGLIIGYAFNKKWSIESGLLWDKKRFYDNGRYFSPAGYTPTSGITIVAVNGRSRFYEWPVNVKYVIIPKKHSLFASAGVSSYYMKQENYDYEYVQNNQPGGHNYLSYKNGTKNWFSVVNISIGYAHKLGDVGSVGVEPYLKLPLKNLGAGNMPIMSTGLNIVFRRTLGR